MAQPSAGAVRRRRIYEVLQAQGVLVVPALLLVVAGFVVAFQFVGAPPPNRFVMATGSESGAYHAWGKLYAERFAEDGIDLVPNPTAGSIENLGLLEDWESGIAVAFVQGGVTEPEAHPYLRSLGSVYFEPLWVFVRGQTPPKRLTELAGKRIAIGRPGSGTLPLALKLLAENGIDGTSAQLIEIGDNEAEAALAAGSVDAAFFVSGPTAPLIRSLLGTPGMVLMSFDQADAYVRRYPFLSRVVLPMGTVDLARNLPAQDTVLLAPTATVVVSWAMHPAHIDLMLLAMRDVHKRGGYFEQPNAFPNARYATYPLADEAERFYERGPPFLQRYLPFWLANLVDRLKVLLLPLITVMYPLFKTFPPIYSWRMRSKVNRWYKDLQVIDDGMRLGTLTSAEALERLDALEHAVERVTVPVAFADSAYSLRLHIEYLSRRAAKMTAGDAAG